MKIAPKYPRILGTVLALFLWGIPSFLLADCRHHPVLGRLAEIWDDSSQKGSVSMGQATEIQRIIGVADLSRVRQGLQQGGLVPLVPQAMTFITDMSQLSSIALADQRDRVATMLLRHDISTRAALLQDGFAANCDPDPADGGIGGGTGDQGAAKPGGADAEGVLRPLSSGIGTLVRPGPSITPVEEARQRRDGWRKLGAVMALLAFGVAAVPAVHYLGLLLRLKRRHRKICEIPATLCVSMFECSGTVFVMGKLGCGFRMNDDADPEMDALTKSGTFCRVKMGETEISGKFLRDATETVGLRFSEPLKIRALKKLLRHSLSQPRTDYCARTAGVSRKWSLGHGQMMRATDDPVADR